MLYGAVIEVEATKTGGWQVTEAVFEKNRLFWQRRNIETHQVLVKVLTWIVVPADARLYDKLLITDGFGVDFITKSVSGYAIKVHPHARLSSFCRSGQKPKVVAVYGSAKRSSKSDDLLDTEAFVAKLQEIGAWPSAGDLSDDDVLSRTSMRVGQFWLNGANNQGRHYLYARVNEPGVSMTSPASQIVALQAMNVSMATSTPSVLLATVAPFMQGAGVLNDQPIFFARTDTFVSGGGNELYFVSDVGAVDTSKGLVVVFDNAHQVPVIYHPKSTSRTPDELATSFGKQYVSRDLALVPLGTPLVESSPGPTLLTPLADLFSGINMPIVPSSSDVVYVPKTEPGMAQRVQDTALYADYTLLGGILAPLRFIIPAGYNGPILHPPPIIPAAHLEGSVTRRAQIYKRIDIDKVPVTVSGLEELGELFVAMGRAGYTINDVTLKGADTVFVPTSVKFVNYNPFE